MADDELYCFKDSGRPCTAECVAYQTFPPEGDDYKSGEPWTHCRLLVNGHREAKHTVLIAQTLVQIKTAILNEAADRKRNPIPPPSPLSPR